MLVGNRRLPVLIAMAGAVAALGFPAPSSAAPTALLDLRVSGQGRIVATIADATEGEKPEVVCQNLELQEVAVCQESYLPGRVVTLKAESVGSSTFGFWSDDRCPAGPVCSLVIDRNFQTVAASFSPQRLMVFVSNKSIEPGTLESAPQGLTCERDTAPGARPGLTPEGARQFCQGDFELDKPVTLTARGVAPAWGAGVFGDTCDAIAIAGTQCSLTVHSRRHVALVFGGRPPDVGEPGDVGLVFRVTKAGTGSGTVRSEALDCGDRCDATLHFGNRQTLLATAARGSRFVRWGRGVCGVQPRCALEVGPVTRITAVFDAVDAAEQAPANRPSAATAPSSTSGHSERGPRPRPRFAARLGRRIVVRRARPRRVVFTVGVNARASIRAVLETARGRRVSARTWVVGAGRQELRLRIPRRARRGTYVLKITVRTRADNVKRCKRSVELRR